MFRSFSANPERLALRKRSLKPAVLASATRVEACITICSIPELSSRRAPKLVAQSPGKTCVSVDRINSGTVPDCSGVAATTAST